MNDETVDQADEEDLLSYEVSDEALEAAAVRGDAHSNVYLLGLLLPELSHSPAFTANIAKLPHVSRLALTRSLLRRGCALRVRS